MSSSMLCMTQKALGYIEPPSYVSLLPSKCLSINGISLSDSAHWVVQLLYIPYSRYNYEAIALV